MAKHNINRWCFHIPVDDIQTDDYNEGAENPCICCGKTVKEPKYYVHMLTDGTLVSTDQPFSYDEDMGFYPIGNACKGKLPNNFYFKVEN